MSLFRSTGLFASIDCPQGTKCELGNCIFRHGDQTNLKRAAGPQDETPVKKPKVAHELVKKPPPSKPLVPEMLNSPPAAYQQRLQFVKVLYDKLEEHGASDCRDTAIKLEADVAKRSTKFTYSMGIRSAVRSIVLGDFFRDTEAASKASLEQVLRKELVNLLVPIPELEKRRYITSVPAQEPFSSDAVVPCDRCGTKFPVYDPATKTSACRFHLLRRQWDSNTKKLSPIFPCCNEPLTESSGCESRDFHVFRMKEPSQLAGMIPFKETPAPQSSSEMGLFAVGLDCEMGWTTKGLELIRVTLVDYDTSKIVMDRLVWPLGRILDLNTRFSGVSNMEDGTEVNGERLPPLTLKDMYAELFKLVTSSTIIVGHGLENDLNALRIVHHRIVDTAILFPRVRTRTHSLKELSWMFLSRNIQSGEHDSMEDSLAAMDIVKADIQQRCVEQKVKSFA